MTKGTENVGEPSHVVVIPAVNVVTEGLEDPKAKAAEKDKSRTERSARKTRRAKALEEQARKEQVAKADGQDGEAPAGDGAEKILVKKTGSAEGNMNDQASKNLEKVMDPEDPTKSLEDGSDATCARATPFNGVRKGHGLRKEHKRRKSRGSTEDAPGTFEMWHMMKDMMSQMREISRTVALVAQQKEPVKENPALSVPEGGRPVNAPEKRVKSHVGIREYGECMKRIEDLHTEKFWGTSDPIAANQWRDRLIRNFESTRCPDEYRRDIAVHLLEGDAYNWWKMTVRQYGERVDTFDAFVKEFDRKYFPDEARDRLEGKFLHLVQGSKTVREYGEEFNALRRHVSEHVPEEGLVRRFLRGLQADIRAHCSVRTFGSVAELVEKAVLVEESLKDRVPRRDDRRGSDSASRKRKYDDTGRSNDRLSCAKCGKAHSGHCRQQGSEVSTQVSGESFVDNRKCYHCKKPGHIVKNCPENDSGSRSRYTDRDGQETQVKKPAGTKRVYELAKDPSTSGQYEAITGKKPVET